MNKSLFFIIFLISTISTFSQCPKEIAYVDYHENITNTEMTSLEIGWSGDLDLCEAGSINSLAKENMIKRINFFRRKAGVNYTIKHQVDLDKYSQAAVLIQHANNSLTHVVDNTFSCYTSDGNQGSLLSNLGYGSNAGPNQVNAFIEDAGAFNADVGHRWWLLFPRMTEVGLGATNKYTAIYIGGAKQQYPDDIEFHSYPGAGYNARDLVYNRWSFAMPDADFSISTVEILKPDGISLVNLKKDPLVVDMGGDDMIVWEPSFMEIIRNSPFDQLYKVTIKNIIVGGQAKDVSYDVIIFDANEDWETCPNSTIWSDNDCGCIEDTPLGFNKGTNHQFSVNPNPFNNNFTLKFPGKSKYKVYSVVGELVGQGSFDNEILIGQYWKPGVYFIVLYTKQGAYFSKKIIKR